MGQGQKYPKIKISSHSGQAVVEYMLLMVIVVAVCIGIGKGFNSLNTFLNKYIGDYTRCLMEYGELPTLGVKAPDLTRHMGGTGKKCDEKFAGFTFENGRPSGGGSGSGGSGNGGSGGNSNSANGSNRKNGDGSDANNKNPNASKKGNGNGSDSDSDSDSANAGGKGKNGENGNGGDSRSPYKNGQVTRAGSPFGTVDGADDSQTVKIIPIEEEENTSRKRKNKNYSAIRNDYDRSGYRPVTGRMQEEYEKKVKNKISRAPTTSVTTIASGGSGVMPFKKQFSQRTYEKPKPVDDDNSKFTIGGFLRFLIIAGMIITIVIFFGGQVMNYSNSKD